MRRWVLAGGTLAVALALGCHREVEMLPLIDRTIYITDKFFDVQALSKDRAIVVGYGGKILETDNGGASWSQIPSGTDEALYSVKMADDQHGWIAGQDGLILHTADGGKSWQPQQSNAIYQERNEPPEALYLFAVDAIDAEHAWAVGDRSILASTSDGGKTWRARKVPMEIDLTGGESMVSADPIFYDVKFLDTQHGWIVGEFGKIMHTEDGGETWHEQEKTLMEGTGIIDPLDLPTLFGLHMKNAEEGIAAGLEGHIARTTDGGQHWRFDPMEIEASAPLYDPLFSPIELPDGSGWAVGGAGEVVHHEPGQAAWKRAKLGQDVLTWLRAVSFSDAQNGWMVGGYGLIFRTTDGGKTWLPSQG